MTASRIKSSRPLVTVGMPVFNGEEFLEEAIESILRQSLPNFELLIVDDASSDASPRIVERFASQDSRIRVITKTQNLGLVSARNTILIRALGKFIAWNDQDDISLPRRLELQVKFFQSHPDVAVCGSWTWVGPGLALHKTLRLPMTHGEILAYMPLYNPISFNTAMLNLPVISREGMSFAEKAGLALDYDFWARAIPTMRFRNIEVVTSLYRTHEHQNSRALGSVQIRQAALTIQEQFMKKHLHFTLTPEYRQLHQLITTIPACVEDIGAIAPFENYLHVLYGAGLKTEAFHAQAWRDVIGFTWSRVLKSSLSSPIIRSEALTRLALSPLTRLVPGVLRQRLAWSSRVALAAAGFRGD